MVAWAYDWSDGPSRTVVAGGTHGEVEVGTDSGGEDRKMRRKNSRDVHTCCFRVVLVGRTRMDCCPPGAVVEGVLSSIGDFVSVCSTPTAARVCKFDNFDPCTFDNG